MLTWQELWAFARTLLRWWPLLIVAALLSAGTAFILTRNQPDYYRARASLMVGNNFEVSAPDRFAVEVSNSLARYYEVLVRREAIMRPAAEQLQLSFDWRLLDRMLYTEINPQANLLEIVITDSNAERAAAIANALGDQLITYSPNAPEKVAAQRAEIERQLRDAQAAIEETDRRLSELRERQSQLNAAIDLRENQEQIDELEKARQRYEATYASLLNLQGDADINTLSFFERASPPEAALPEKTLMIIGGAGLAGLLVACVAVFILEALDDRWRPGSGQRQHLGIRNLGGVYYPGIYVDRPASHEQAVRETHTELMLAANGRPPRLLLVSSPEPSAERSEYAIDLAGVYGQAGHRVLLVDAELAQPQASRIISERTNGNGAPQTTMAIEPWLSHSARRPIPRDLWVRLRPTHLSNVVLLPGRTPTDGQPVLVPLLHWPELIEHLRDAADVIIFDGPSTLTGADAALLAPLVDGVVLVLSAANTTRAQIEETKARLLHSPEARLLGAVTVTTARRARRRRSGRFALSVGRDGVTITLPGPERAQPLLSSGDKHYPSTHATSPEHRSGPSPEERDPMLNELLGQPQAGAEQERAVGGTDQVIITPPPARVIVTPPPGTHPARRTVAKPRSGRTRYRSVDAGAPSAADREEQL
jgi:Mrp family chromosome partitioning ATPase/capsular polysaccharide biosynthesis protein